MSSKKLYVLFTKPKKFDLIALAIRAFIFAPYCHAALEKDSMIFQAAEDGVEYVTKNHFYAKHVVVAKFEIILDIKELQKLREVEKKLQNRKYDWKSVFGLALVRLGLPSLFRGNDKKFFCSELCYAALSLVVKLPKVDQETLDPKRLLRLLERAGIKRLF